MKSNISRFVFIGILATNVMAAGNGAAQASKGVFDPGQRLNFDVSLNGQIVAGELSVETVGRTMMSGVNAYHVRANLRSVGIVKALNRNIDESYDSYINPSTLNPISFTGSSSGRQSESVKFENGSAVSSTGHRMRIPSDTYDPASLLFIVRTINLKQGQRRVFHMLRGGKLYTASVEPDGREKVYTRGGDYDANRLAIKLVGESGESDSYRIRLYLTRDARRLPVLITADAPGGAGQIRVELMSHSG